jgi:lysophospholipid acyltransferase (LPLAT)-like uncharacterized protein
MYAIRWINHGYYTEHKFLTVSTAISYAKAKCQEAAIHDRRGDIVACWHPLHGATWMREATP